MELRHLRYFVAVAGELSFRRAGERLNVSLSPLVRQIKDLETELGAELFTRAHTGLSLTEAGRVFLDEANTVLNHTRQAVARVRAMADGGCGRLRITHSYGYLDPWLPEVLDHYRALHPGVAITRTPLHAREQFAALAADELDIGYCVVRSHAAERLPRRRWAG